MVEPRRVQGGVVGTAVGDALGLPVQSEARSRRRDDEVTGMRGGGIHGQAEGTWSDETSLTLCTVEALLGDYSISRLGDFFTRWLQEAYWTPHGEVFDAEPVTREAIDRVVRGGPLVQSRSDATAPNSDGNGSLVRMLPIAVAFTRRSIPVMLERVHEASQVTHPHPLCLMACGLYALVVRNLLYNRPPRAAYRYAAEHAREVYIHEPWRGQRPLLRRLLRGTIGEVSPEHINFGTNVIDTLEAAVWSLASTRSFRDCVLRAVNLGENADAVGALAGGLAGLAYGYDAIPTEWIDALARKEELIQLSNRFAVVITT